MDRADDSGPVGRRVKATTDEEGLDATPDDADGPDVPRWVDALGWTGTSVVLLAHFLANAEQVSDAGLVYHGLNFTGSVLLGYLCVRRRVWQSVWLNAVWGAVAAVAIARALAVL